MRQSQRRVKRSHPLTPALAVVTKLRLRRPRSGSQRIPLNRAVEKSPRSRSGKPKRGFEPLTPCLQDRCSDQLSYFGRIVKCKAAERLSGTRAAP